ncbi:proline-rich domain-containing protein [Streptomyces sp. NPDC051954]|uniref:proline-rich domain-containing protein n=1 Tax=Streptomyces sp. NPDC051954 TaxID=3155524 RepID=UPI003415A708
MTTPPPQGQNPFAQGQNPYAQPQGQAPYPPQAGAPYAQGQPGFPPQGGTPYPPVPPATPPRRFSKKLLRIVGVIVLAIVIALVKWQMGKTDAETTSVGSCLHNKGSQSEPDLATVDCSSGEAQYTVVEKFDNTSDGSKCDAVKEAEIAYYQVGDSHDVVLCLKSVK